MKISFNDVNDIVSVLPIGLYCQRRIPTELSKEAEASYYNTKEDKIVISYPSIALGIQSIKEEDLDKFNEENLVRSLVYHELSHAILTDMYHFNLTKYYMNVPRGEEDKIFNIFEDERIETVLEDYYLDVNFKKTFFYMNGGVIKEPKTKIEGFYNLVRFRVCDDKNLLERVDKIIYKYADLTSYFDSNDWKENDRKCKYYQEIGQLYNDFCRTFPNLKNSSSQEQREQKQNEMSQQFGKSCGQGTSNSKKADNQNQNGSGEQSGNNNGQGENGNSEENKNGNGNANGQSQGNEENGEDKEGKGQQKQKGHGCSPQKLASIFNKAVNGLVDNNLTANLEAIISQFNKKNKGGSGTVSYSGVFNPRNVARRDDYKYFDRSLAVNGNNSFGKFHLNLFVDDSGSFENNKKRANTLFKSLEDIEQRNKNFSFDVIRCGSGMTECPKNERRIEANDGTSLDYNETKRIFEKHNRKKDCYVSNIILYDGYCSQCNVPSEKVARKLNCFSIMDTDNTTFIIEEDNRLNCENLKSAKVVNLGYGNNYVEHLTDEVTKALSKAFR